MNVARVRMPIFHFIRQNIASVKVSRIETNLACPVTTAVPQQSNGPRSAFPGQKHHLADFAGRSPYSGCFQDSTSADSSPPRNDSDKRFKAGALQLADYYV
jgi:hypothetical protein